MSSSPLDRGPATGLVEAASAAQDAAGRRIGVDRRVVRWANGTGSSIYAEGLRRGVQDAGFSLTTLMDAPASDIPTPGRLWRWMAAQSPLTVAARPHMDGLLSTDVYRRAQVHFDIYGRYLRLRSASPPGLMHWSYLLPLHVTGVPNLYSVLDLIPLLYPDLTAIRQARSRRMLTRLRSEAAHLVTISETSRREIIQTLNWPEDRVTNTYLPVESPSWTAQQALLHRSQALETVGVAERDYFLHVGTIERRKNIARLIEAYRSSGSCRALVLAGPQGWHAADELAGAGDLLVSPGPEARQAAGRPRVIRIGWLPRETVLGLIQGAVALLAPSLAEGFGLPAIEAMGLGTPALTSAMGAPAEIAGTAALLVDPTDMRQLTLAITALDRDADLRGRLSEDGLARARVFSAEAYAARLSALYGMVLARDAAP